jgi:CBS domain-containing protein
MFPKFLRLPISSVSIPYVPQIFEGQKVRDALIKLAESNLEVVLIVDSSNKLKGLVTNRDLKRLAFVDQDDPVEKLGTKDIVAIKAEAEIWQMLKILNGENRLKIKLDYLPVVDDDNRVLGIVTRRRLLEMATFLDYFTN